MVVKETHITMLKANLLQDLEQQRAADPLSLPGHHGQHNHLFRRLVWPFLHRP